MRNATLLFELPRVGGTDSLAQHVRSLLQAIRAEADTVAALAFVEIDQFQPTLLQAGLHLGGLRQTDGQHESVPTRPKHPELCGCRPGPVPNRIRCTSAPAADRARGAWRTAGRAWSLWLSRPAAQPRQDPPQKISRMARRLIAAHVNRPEALCEHRPALPVSRNSFTRRRTMMKYIAARVPMSTSTPILDQLAPVPTTRARWSMVNRSPLPSYVIIALLGYGFHLNSALCHASIVETTSWLFAGWFLCLTFHECGHLVAGFLLG